MPFINKLKKFELENNRPYPIGDEIVCGKEVWPKIVDSEPKSTHNHPSITQVVEENSHNPKNEICKLYDNLVKKRGGEDVVKEFEYIWQWLISQSEYNNISDTLTHCRSLNGKEQQVLLESRKCIWVIVAYIAERYKREWNGNNKDYDNPFKELGLAKDDNQATQCAKKVAKSFWGENSPKIFVHESGRNTEWLESLRMEGGLPIKYIVDKNKLDFTKDIYENPQKAIEALEANNIPLVEAKEIYRV
jgi:hypothetical protein